MNTFKSYL